MRAHENDGLLRPALFWKPVARASRPLRAPQPPRRNLASSTAQPADTMRDDSRPLLESTTYTYACLSPCLNINSCHDRALPSSQLRDLSVWGRLYPFDEVGQGQVKELAADRVLHGVEGVLDRKVRIEHVQALEDGLHVLLLRVRDHKEFASCGGE